MSTWVTVMTAAIAILGVLTVALSVAVGVVFWRIRTTFKTPSEVDRYRLTGALALQLFGEGIIGLGTLIFAFAAHRGWLPHWPIEAQSMLRITMFMATGLTTLHLFAVVAQLTAANNSNDRK